MNRRYYSTRTGKNPRGIHLDLNMARRLFKNLYLSMTSAYYFQEAFGFECVDSGRNAGILGDDVGVAVLLAIRKDNLWPVENNCDNYSEDDLFDVIEFLYDNVSKPLEGYYHDYASCGMHYSTFDKQVGRDEYRQRVNIFLTDYDTGYELSNNGEILSIAEPGLELLFQADIPEHDPNNIDTRVNNAVLKFRRHRSSIEERRDAIRDLADVLEFLRPKLKQVITRKDEGDLFNIANNFAIRHHNLEQQTDYDKPIWYSWMFYFYLATYHATIRLIKKKETD